ncbi:MAG TPA: hypothetical protein QGF02_01440 [Candidatus Babeliales bacterium]|nr:hypothetical protein [Candidatus Babeliales bacterium]
MKVTPGNGSSDWEIEADISDWENPETPLWKQYKYKEMDSDLKTGIMTGNLADVYASIPSNEFARQTAIDFSYQTLLSRLTKEQQDIRDFGDQDIKTQALIVYARYGGASKEETAIYRLLHTQNPAKLTLQEQGWFTPDELKLVREVQKANKGRA